MTTQKKHDLLLPGACADRLDRAAFGMEAEFVLLIDDEPARPEDVFGSPRNFIRGDLMHRRGTSYHLPNGGAIYFDTGVIEVATPAIEIERGCAARAGRSLWEGIAFIRGELDDWEKRAGKSARLSGFSAHYNVSFEPDPARPPECTVGRLALLLSYILPAPVMLLGTNRRSTGVGVRPRGNRIEITADFTPNPALMIATGAVIAGIVRDVMTWPSFELDQLERHGVPVFAGYSPVPHTSRKGWLARYSSYPRNPFTTDVDEVSWQTTDGRTRSLRGVARSVVRTFGTSIRRVADPFTFRLIQRILAGRAPSLLEMEDRPAAYDDVGRACSWTRFVPRRWISPSRYEQVLVRAIAGGRLRLFGRWYTPVGMRGWSRVVFRTDDGKRHTFPIDFLTNRLDDWETSRATPSKTR